MNPFMSRVVAASLFAVGSFFVVSSVVAIVNDPKAAMTGLIIASFVFLVAYVFDVVTET